MGGQLTSLPWRKYAHRFTLLAHDLTGGHYESIMDRNHIDPLVATELDRGDISPQLVHLVFDICKDVIGAELGENLGHESSGNGQALVVGFDDEGDVELFEFGLKVFSTS